jgi:hypothetical protein
MDEFAGFDELSVLASIATLLLMAIWGCAIVAIDRWVWAGRADVLPRPGWDGGDEIAPRGDETRHVSTAGRGMARPPQLRPRLNKRQ